MQGFLLREHKYVTNMNIGKKWLMCSIDITSYLSGKVIDIRVHI